MGCNTLTSNGSFSQSFDESPFEICDTFVSIQAEGKDTGTHALFIRLSGCNLRCSYCDTKYSWDRGVEVPQWEVIEYIRDYQTKYNNGYIVWTGGEPMLQESRIYNVIMKTRDCYHHLETNGIIVPEKPHLFNDIAVSPKTKLDTRWLTIKNAHIKLVVDDISEVKDFQEIYDFPVHRLYVMAKTDMDNIPAELEKEKRLVKDCVTYGYNFSPRLQMLYGWGRSQ